MKAVLLTIESSRPSWWTEFRELYSKKINGFLDFEVSTLKSADLGRASSAQKLEKESQLLLAKIRPDDFVVLCDERGRPITSVEFSKKLVGIFESGKKRAVFVIGGAFGVNDVLRARSNLTLNLSPFTLNHLVAQSVLLEQIFRGLSIWKGLPYHNE